MLVVHVWMLCMRKCCADAVSASASADAVGACYAASANADAVSTGAANAATKHGMVVQCSVMHAEARRSRKCNDATRQVSCSSKLVQQGL